MVSEITLHAVVEIPDEKDTGKAGRILQKVKSSCVISNSITSKVHFRPDVRVSVPV